MIELATILGTITLFIMGLFAFAWALALIIASPILLVTFVCYILERKNAKKDKDAG